MKIVDNKIVINDEVEEFAHFKNLGVKIMQIQRTLVQLEMGEKNMDGGEKKALQNAENFLVKAAKELKKLKAFM